MLTLPATLATILCASAAASPDAYAAHAAAASPSPPQLSVHDGTLFRSLFLVAFGGVLLVMALRRLRTYRLRERYAVVFATLGLPFIGLAFWPDGVGWIANKLNIQYNTLALLGVSVFLLLVVFELLSIVSVQDRKITALAQLVGILMERQNLVEKEHRAEVAEANSPTDVTRAGDRESALMR